MFRKGSISLLREKVELLYWNDPEVSSVAKNKLLYLA